MYLFKDIEQFNWKTFLLGMSCVGTLLGLKKLATKYPKLKWTRAAGPLLVTVVSIVLQATIDMEARGIPIVGHIPAGLPSFTGSVIFPVSNTGIINVVISIAIVGFMESIAIAKKLAQVHGYELDSSQELAGLGACAVNSLPYLLLLIDLTLLLGLIQRSGKYSQWAVWRISRYW
jgi:MFS superfamily sulfate permease-like transporter